MTDWIIKEYENRIKKALEQRQAAEAEAAAAFAIEVVEAETELLTKLEARGRMWGQSITGEGPKAPEPSASPPTRYFTCGDCEAQGTSPGDVRRHCAHEDCSYVEPEELKEELPHAAE